MCDVASHRPTTTTTTPNDRCIQAPSPLSETAQSFRAARPLCIENFIHDLLLCPLFMLHFKGLSVIINSRGGRRNETRACACAYCRGTYYTGVGLSIARLEREGTFLPAFMVSQRRRKAWRRREFATVMISGAKYQRDERDGAFSPPGPPVVHAGANF